MITVIELSRHLEKLAPYKLAASWDNSGLLIGLPEDKVNKVLISLDVTDTVVAYAVEIGADVIVSHHPYLRNAMKNVTDPLIIKLIRNSIALISMHTNLDFITGGVNTELAKLIGLSETEFLHPVADINYYHLALYTPANAVEQVAKALFAAGAGVIGNYDHCLNEYKVKGQFKPLADSNPTIGSAGSIEEVEEIKMEFYADEAHLDNVIKAIHSSHPYETPAYSVYPLAQNSLNYGLGLVGNLPQPISLKELALHTKKRLDAPFVNLWLAGHNRDTLVQKIAVCGGNGSDLVKVAEKKAEVYITADLKYHTVIGSSIPLIDAGHFHTESPVLPKLKEYLEPLQLDVHIFSSNDADINGLICL